MNPKSLKLNKDNVNYLLTCFGKTRPICLHLLLTNKKICTFSDKIFL